MRTPDIVSRAEAIMAKFEARASADYGLADANAQVTRALRRFAIIAAGGELATEAGITGWAAGEAADAIQEVFGLWVRGRGGLMSAADRNAVANTRAFLIKNEARFHKLIPRRRRRADVVGEPGGPSNPECRGLDGRGRLLGLQRRLDEGDPRRRGWEKRRPGAAGCGAAGRRQEPGGAADPSRAARDRPRSVLFRQAGDPGDRAGDLT